MELQSTELSLPQKNTFRSILCDTANKFSWLRDPLLVLLGSTLIAVGALINMPLHPLPITLQSLAVLFVALTLGFRLSVAAVFIYIAAALAGLPLLGEASLELMSGYLVGFFLAAALLGFLAERGWSSHVFSTITAAFAGTVLILLCGWIVLTYSLGPWEAFKIGIKPFLLASALKIIFLACVVPNFWRLSEKQLQKENNHGKSII